MAFKGFKKTESTATVNHFEEVAQKQKAEVGQGVIGRPVVTDYQKQDKRMQFYVSQELLDVLQPIAFANGCKDVNALAKKLLVEEFERVKKLK